jgi:predicted PhzF superfamily epimerase YddE/YHI9
MTSFRYMHLDVFTAGLGGGNHLGVVVDANRWSAHDMQRFARWTNLVETTFLLPPNDPKASYRVRMFTPHKEIPFAGHPSIGSAHAALESGLVEPRDGLLWQECGAGTLPIRVQGGGGARELSLLSPPQTVVQSGHDAHPLLAAALAGVDLGRLPPLVAGAIGELARSTGSMGICAFARSASGDYQLVVRALAAGAGIVEDPASGAANGCIAAYLAQVEPDGDLAHGYIISQGREIGHDARLVASIDGDAIWIGGRTATVVEGTLHWTLGE